MKQKTGRKLLSFLLTLAMVMGLVPGMSLTAYAEGDGTEANPIEITSWTGLSSAMSGTAPTGESVNSPTYYKLTQNVEATSSTSGILVGKSRHVVLDLNGKTIDRKLTSATENGYVIRVEGNLTIKDSVTGGNITGGYNNNSSPGGGVYIQQNAKFNMKGGTISGNTAGNAGGVYVNQNAEFTMEGGTISGNTAKYNGGGVQLPYGAKFNMKGGTISGNSAEGYFGGGVLLNDGAEFCLSGMPIINDNKLKGNTVNVHIVAGTIKLTGALESGASVGVTMKDPGVFTSSADPIKASGYKDCFSSDDSTYTVTTDGNELKLSSHEHDFTYSVTGATITATCVATGCDLPPSTAGDTDHVATLTINAPEHKTTGDGKSAVATLTDLNSIHDDATVSYYKANAAGTDKDGQELGSAPTDAGKYWAEITLGTGENTATAHVVYDISDPEYTITLPTGLAGGTVTANKVKAKFNEVVTLTAAPADDDHVLRTLTVKDEGGKDVTVTDNQFTMPASDVTVSATFAEKTSAAVALTVNKVNEKGGTASLLKEDFAPLDESAQVREGDKFILCVTPEEEYDFTVAFSTNADREELSEQDYKDYLTYAQTNNITVSLNTVMYWVTMPYVESGNLTATVEFGVPHAYTILYQPDANTDAVFCKIATADNESNPKYAMMSRGATLGDTTVWSLTITSSFNPTKIAFVGSNAVSTDEDKTALKNKLQSATPSDATVSQTTPSNWPTIDGGKYLIIGGTAKVVTAIFVTDPKAVTTVKDNTVDAASCARQSDGS